MCSAVSGNYAIIGANLYEGSINTDGIAYIYELDTDNTDEPWQLSQPLDAPTSSNSYFGNAVDISDDYAIVGDRAYRGGLVEEFSSISTATAAAAGAGNTLTLYTAEILRAMYLAKGLNSAWKLP